ncbi:hypothetical protein BJF85_01465 [Saccharomonospora sp. CUA-673]|nr:hypothetical protein BJF85_01465 [Saccharomonospora sp. CUA-673]
MSRKITIDHGRIVRAFGDEVELLIDAARCVPPDTPVPTCPGWTVGDTMRHVGSVYRAAQAWLIDGRRPGDWQREPAPGQSQESYVRQGYADLKEVLDFHDAQAEAPTWWPDDPTYGFWRRRMAHDTVIHRVDVEGAGGAMPVEITGSGVPGGVGGMAGIAEPSGNGDDIAVDGVDEALMLWFGHRLPRLGLCGTRVGEVAVVTGGRGWITVAGPDRVFARRCDPAEAQSVHTVVSGEPVEVYLWLWGRRGPGAVTIGSPADGADGARAPGIRTKRVKRARMQVRRRRTMPSRSCGR